MFEPKCLYSNISKPNISKHLECVVRTRLAGVSIVGYCVKLQVATCPPCLTESRSAHICKFAGPKLSLLLPNLLCMVPQYTCKDSQYSWLQLMASKTSVQQTLCYALNTAVCYTVCWAVKPATTKLWGVQCEQWSAHTGDMCCLLLCITHSLEC